MHNVKAARILAGSSYWNKFIERWNISTNSHAVVIKMCLINGHPAALTGHPFQLVLCLDPSGCLYGDHGINWDGTCTWYGYLSYKDGPLTDMRYV